jgi:large subunit ribosomal protein L35Ae
MAETTAVKPVKVARVRTAKPRPVKKEPDKSKEGIQADHQKPQPQAAARQEEKSQSEHQKPHAQHAARPGERPSTDAKTGLIISYRRGRHTQHTNQMLVEVSGADTKAKASAYIGRRIVWKTSSGRLIYGTLTHPHGRNGLLRARFSQGMPGDALRKSVKVV